MCVITFEASSCCCESICCCCRVARSCKSLSVISRRGAITCDHIIMSKPDGRLAGCNDDGWDQSQPFASKQASITATNINVLHKANRLNSVLRSLPRSPGTRTPPRTSSGFSSMTGLQLEVLNPEGANRHAKGLTVAVTLQGKGHSPKQAD